jgi:predicted transcriptional regulator
MNKIIISYKSTKQFLDEAMVAFKEITSGQTIEGYKEISFTDKQTFTKFLKNIDILMAIKSSKPRSVYELAKILGRDQSNVNKVVLFFESYGVVEIKKSIVNKRVLNMPLVNFDKIEFDLTA